MAATTPTPSPAQFIGSKISLISKSEIRYEGILYALDVAEATISLAKVKSFGTEDRPTERPIAAKDEIYEFIIFRGTDIRVIDVIEPPKTTANLTTGLSSDPAIVEVSHCHSTGQGGLSSLGQAKANLFSNPPPQTVQPQIQVQPQVPPPQPRVTNVFDGLLGSARVSLANDASVQVSKNQRGNRRGRQNQRQTQNQNTQTNQGGQNQNNGGQQRQGGGRQGQQRGNNFGGQLQNQQQQMRGGGRFGGRGGFNQRAGFGRKKGMLPQQQAKVSFDVEYDFEKANEELIGQLEKIKLNDSGTENQEKVNESEKPEETEPAPFYQKENFFDNISCEASEIAKGNGHRPDWRAERKLNTETFGNMANRRSGGYQSRNYGRGGGGGFYRGYNRGYGQPYGGYGGFNGFNGYNNFGNYGRYRGGNRGGMVF